MVRIENFYTVEQLFTFLDLDYKDYDVLVNNMPANKHTKVYENFMVSFSNVPKQTSYADLEDDTENEGPAHPRPRRSPVPVCGSSPAGTSRV